jgi:hypothetical protein
MMQNLREDLLEDGELAALRGYGLCKGKFGLSAKGFVHAFDHSFLRMHGVRDGHFRLEYYNGK